MAATGFDALVEDAYVDGLPELPMAELRRRRGACQDAETALSYLRRLVQGRLDILHGELDRRKGGAGEKGGGVGDLVENLPGLLGDNVRGGGLGRLPSAMAPDLDDPHFTAVLDAIVDDGRLATVDTLDGDEIHTLVDALVGLEEEVSSKRRALHERIDTFQHEIVRRYQTGEASVDSLLP